MRKLSNYEESIWEERPQEPSGSMTDEDIEAKYARGEGRILVEANRERLGVFVSGLTRPGYMELSPFYQRRSRWDDVRRSQLIESFIMNIPVPPVFLYEKAYGRYEVMDGQQRISAIKGFYNNEFALKGLEHWTELNGRRHNSLPRLIRDGIDRRSVSSVVLIRESTASEEEVSLLRRTVFDRLNRGGVKLERQEIRNALFAGPFNALLDRLAHRPAFEEAWGIDSDKSSSFYKKMGDLEVVLRFFALRNVGHYRRSLQDFLDLYMAKMKKAEADTLAELEGTFDEVLRVSGEIYGDLLFRPFDLKTSTWASKPNKGFCDCVLIGVWRNLDRAGILTKNREEVVAATRSLVQEHEDGTFTGRRSTRQDLVDRLDLFDAMLSSVG